VPPAAPGLHPDDPLPQAGPPEPLLSPAQGGLFPVLARIRRGMGAVKDPMGCRHVDFIE
jgi:hypothetical protein